MKRGLGLCALGISIFVIAGCGQVNGRIAANSGHSAYLAKDFDKAIASYEEALLSLPDNKIIQRNLAYAALSRSWEDIPQEEARQIAKKAVALLEALLESEPDNDEIISLLLDAWEQNDRLGDAVQFFTARIEKDPKDLQSLKGLGVVELKRGNYEGALAVFKKRLAFSPNDAQLSLLIAQTSWQWLRAGGPNELEDAIALASSGVESAMQAAKLDPDKVEPWVFARLILFQRVELHTENPEEIEKDRLEIESVNKKIEEINEKANALLKKVNEQKAGDNEKK